MQTYFLAGLDLGKVRDYTALAIVQRINKGQVRLADGTVRNIVKSLYFLRHIERFPQNVPYPDTVDLLKQVLGGKLFQGRSRLVLDATGCGLPVSDLFEARRIGVPITRVVITGGFNTNKDQDTDTWRVPKQTLVSTMQVLLQNGRLKIAENIEDAQKFTKELLEFEVRISDSGRDQYGTWREGAHDDMVFAVALACWAGEQGMGAVVPGLSLPVVHSGYDSPRGRNRLEEIGICASMRWGS